MEDKLTYLEAYKSMICFLEIYYELTDSEDVGSLLNGMRILEDNSTVDPAMWKNWEKCVEKTISYYREGDFPSEQIRFRLLP